MLKLFFNRESPVVLALNLLVAAHVLFFWVWYPQSWGWISGFVAFSWLFFNFLDWIPWYPRYSGKLGIRLHFQRSVIPVIYLAAFFFAWKWTEVPEIWFWPLCMFFLPMYYVTFMLLGFHFRDPGEVMPSYFSRQFYLQEESADGTAGGFGSGTHGNDSAILSGGDRLRGGAAAADR